MPTSLSLEGPRYVAYRTEVYIFHVTSNMYLVMNEDWFFELPYLDRASKRKAIDNSLLQTRVRLDFETPERKFPTPDQQRLSTGSRISQPHSDYRTEEKVFYQGRRQEEPRG